ncbi:MAG: hypothetical protein WCH39_07830 [Schlesneria sp.]|jgi:hypothetical protein
MVLLISSDAGNVYQVADAADIGTSGLSPRLCALQSLVRIILPTANSQKNGRVVDLAD